MRGTVPLDVLQAMGEILYVLREYLMRLLQVET